MQAIGTIKFVQVQRGHMKVYQGADRIYRPDPLLRVEKLLLTGEGIIGLTSGGEKITDVHHVKHSQSRYRGDNKISFGFAQQYQRMRQRFGDHISDGAGGENIIIESNNAAVAALNYQSRFFIKAHNDDKLIELTGIIPAPPCREFSIFCLQVPQCQEDIQAALQFLDNGTRGYYAELLTIDNPCFVQAGDTVYIS